MLRFSLINDQWYKARKASNVDEAERIVLQAAKVILGQIRCTTFHMDTYPAHEDISSIELGKRCVPSYLWKFMEALVKKQLKYVSLGQALKNAVKPRLLLSPVVFGLGIEVELVFGSKWVLIQLNLLGFSVSPDEATRYQQSIVCNEN